ncbi:MAG: SDR family NAD(P)-dependent oxidoreductase [Ignavibacteriaceae bacterium]
MKKNLLIFGSNGALGKGVTESLSKKDYDKIYLFDHNIENNIAGERVSRIKVDDLSVELNVSKAFQNVSASKDELFFLYTTVGGFSGGKSLWETEVSEWDKMINMNLKTSFLIAKYFALLVKNSAGGSICFTAAFTGLNPEINKSAYGVSKSGLVHLTKSLALEGEEINLSVNAIAPYIIDTPANRKWMKDSDFSKWVKPSEIGELAYNLFSSFYFITGNIILLNKRFNI